MSDGREPTEIARLSSCLFCGQATDEPETDEDVFPKWLQRECSLVDKQVVLLNGTAVRYPQLTVPACQPCNNVHASQLEQRVREGRASDQDMWIWLLKIQLGMMWWETSARANRDLRHPDSQRPILPSDAMDFRFLCALFDALKNPSPQFAPNPMGSVFSFDTTSTDFYYADKLYRHPSSGPDDDNYSASCIVFHGRCWIVLFDDAGQIQHSAVDLDAMRRQVADGKDPVQFFPELMYLRACLDWTPSTLVVGGADGRAGGVAFTLPMSQPATHERRTEDLMLFYDACGFQTGE